MRYSSPIVFLFIASVASASGDASVGVSDTMEERVKACTICHDNKDRVGRDAYYPRIAGKPAGYLFNQIRNFRDGKRHYQPMAILLENMSDEYMQEIAYYFSSLKLPYPPPERISIHPEETKLADTLIHLGDPRRDIPACKACHGEALMGTEPFIPGLLGLSHTYISAQFGSWRNGGLMRGQSPNCMSEIAKQLTDEETNAIAKWLAIQPASGKPSPSNALSSKLIKRCSSIGSSNTYTLTTQSTLSASGQQQILGAYLARAGNCKGCHTAKNGDPFAGGKQMYTSFGTFITPNITPDKETGIGLWSKEDFWKALHWGEARDGRMLYPSFPYPEYTKVTRQDADAIFAYLMSLSPVSKLTPSSNIFFPYNLKPLLYAWRKLYFKEGVYEPDKSKSKEWNRGAYLAQGLGHCSACHSSRNLLGASQEEKLLGKKMTGVNWYAPSLISRLEAGSGELEIEEITELLLSGITKRAVASGHMATVIKQSLQFLSHEDIHAIAIYLKSIGSENSDVVSAASFPIISKDIRRNLTQGGKLYKKHCEDCHQPTGKGIPSIYPSLAGNRSVTMASPLNTIRSVMYGGFPPTTSGNLQPYGMPPFQQILRDEEIALVVSYIRNTWGNRSSMVREIDVDRSRNGKY